MTSDLTPQPKHVLSKPQKLVRLLLSVLDPRAYLHMFKLINYYNYSHVAPLRDLKKGPNASISPNAIFANADKITLGARVTLGARCALWAGAGNGRSSAEAPLCAETSPPSQSLSGLLQRS